MNTVAFAATVMSVFSMVLTLMACSSGETVNKRMAAPQEPIVIDKSAQTSVTRWIKVDNNGTTSTAVINGEGSIVYADGIQDDLTLNTKANATVSLREAVVKVSAEQTGNVTLSNESNVSVEDKTSTAEIAKSFTKNFTFSDGQTADAVYDYAYTAAQEQSGKELPHVEVTEVSYVDYTAMQIAENQYKVVLHFTATLKDLGTKSPKTEVIDLYPEYIQEVEASAPQWSYDEEVKYHFNEQDARLKLEWRLTRNDGKKFSIWALVAEFYRPSGHDELHVTSGDIVSSTEEILDTKEKCLAALPHAERCFFTKKDGAFTISSTAFGKHIVRTWMMESGVDMPGMDITALMQVGTEVSFTDPETGVSFSKTFRGELKVSEEKDVNLHKEGVNVQGRFFPYIHTHQLTVESTLYGPDNYVYKFSHTAETNLYKVQ